MAAKFLDDVKAQLETYYAKGMVGIGQKYESMIELACQKTGLNDIQVKVRLI